MWSLIRDRTRLILCSTSLTFSVPTRTCTHLFVNQFAGTVTGIVRGVTPSVLHICILNVLCLPFECRDRDRGGRDRDRGGGRDSSAERRAKIQSW